MSGGRGLAVATYQDEEFDLGYGGRVGSCMYVCTEATNAATGFSVGGCMSPP